MAKLGRWAGYIIGGLFLLLLLAALNVWAVSAKKLHARHQARTERLIPMAEASAELGRHLLVTHGCIECHGSGMRGAVFLDDPKVGTIYAPNLTTIARHATDQQLAQAIRQGISHDGRALVVMPSESYSNFTDEETAALVKAIRALPTGGAQTPPPKFGPLGRIAVVSGKLKTAPELIADYSKRPAPDLGPQYSAGRHTAITVCSGCHGPDLSGREPQPGVLAPDLMIAGAYDLPAFTRLLRTGVPASGRELRMMSGVSRKAFSRMSDSEVADLHAYLVARASR